MSYSLQNDDYAIALMLQEEENLQKLHTPTKVPTADDMELTPDIRDLFLNFDREYFYNSLASVEVKWSNRMTLCAGLCEYHGGGYCVIKLSEKLLQYRSKKELFETLLHEMIHAFLFITVMDRDRDGHGEQFQSHMHRINKAGGYRITIYHSFMEEVAYFQQHHWKCEGKCGRVVKRAMNRAPNVHDDWWAAHQRQCGGNFVKIKEPDGYEKRLYKKKDGKKQKTEKGKKRDTKEPKLLGGNGDKQKTSNESNDKKRKKDDSPNDGLKIDNYFQKKEVKIPKLKDHSSATTVAAKVVISLVDDDMQSPKNNSNRNLVNNNNCVSVLTNVTKSVDNANLVRSASKPAIIIVDDDEPIIVDRSKKEITTRETTDEVMIIDDEKELSANSRSSIFSEATLVIPAGAKFYHRSHLQL